MELITHAQTLEALRSLPPESANAEECLYAHEVPLKQGEALQPSCIVGHVLALLAPETFTRVVASHNYENVQGLTTRGYLGEFHPHAVALLSNVQDYADSGHEWGSAIDSALHDEG